jgi:SprT-like family
MEQWNAYQEAWSWFNVELFDGQLEPCILNFSRKSKRNLGFFAPERWEKAEQAVPEISLNPDQLHRPLVDTMSTLVHEMVHQWQYQYGSPSRSGYHNREWGDKMKEIGLHPSNTGQPGGRETGQQMTHYIVEDGPFDQAFQAMPKDYGIPWTSGLAQMKPTPKKIESKVKFTCPGCYANAWGKSGLLIKCKPCDLGMMSSVKGNLCEGNLSVTHGLLPEDRPDTVYNITSTS